MEWQISQFFGDKSSLQNSTDQDNITAVSFNKQGTHICLGDNAGRMIFFSQKQTKKNSCQSFQYFTQLQSHMQDFDPLKSQTIPQQINAIQWLQGTSNKLYILSTNDKIIKLWKLSQKVIRKVVKPSGKQLAMPVLQNVEQTVYPSLQKSFPNLHTSKIKAISASKNQQFLLSSQKQKLLLWSIQNPSKAFIIYDINRSTLQNINQSIQTCSFHPFYDNIFLYSTTTGSVNLIDTRVKITHPQVIKFTYPKGTKNFFSQYIALNHDAKFFPNATNIVSRDVLSIRIWDVRYASKPTITSTINDQVKNRLCDLYDNECLWDQFNLSVSPNNKNILTGSYNNTFNLMDNEGKSNIQFDVNFNKKVIMRQLIGQKLKESDVYEYRYKTLKNAYHPSQQLIAVTCLNSLFFYHKK